MIIFIYFFKWMIIFLLLSFIEQKSKKERIKNVMIEIFRKLSKGTNIGLF